jgi:hypothetical protein
MEEAIISRASHSGRNFGSGPDFVILSPGVTEICSLDIAFSGIFLLELTLHPNNLLDCP